ncbi:MAG TPA: MFS transporter [Candidatus Rubrimentiphilum sp.]|nr:MFS transporter [Candidatus Rubrimentiphilum sp.]
MSRALWFVAAAFCVTMIGTTLPTPLYPIYQQTFGFSGALVTVIFATYAFAVIAGLMLFGHLSDRIGRKRVLIPGLILSALSAVVFMTAAGLPAVLVGRVLSGLSAGIFTGTATATLVELAGDGRRTVATMLAVAANIGGLGTGTLLSGLLAQYATRPLFLPFAVDLALLVPVTAGVCFAPETVKASESGFRLRVQRLRIPREIRGIFIRAAIAGICGFAVSGLFSAVVPTFLVRVLHDRNHAIPGLLVFLLFALSAIGQIAVNRVEKKFALPLAAAALLAGVLCLAAAIWQQSLLLFFISAAVAGFGQGLGIGFGLAEINEEVEEQRGEVSSTYFVLLYIGLAIPVIGVGFISEAIGLIDAGLVFCAFVGATIAAVLASLPKMQTQ